MDPEDMRLTELVADWLSVPEVAERLSLSPSAVRRLIEERHLIGVRPGTGTGVRVPAVFLGEDGPLPALRGTFVVLADGGMDDEEILRWLFTADASLPVEGAPIDAIRAGFKTEVRRRAMEQAF